MRRTAILLLPIVALATTVPWWFWGDGGSRLFGLPGWAAYSLAATALFSLVLATLLGRYWDLSAGREEDDDAGDR